MTTTVQFDFQFEVNLLFDLVFYWRFYIENIYNIY